MGYDVSGVNASSSQATDNTGANDEAGSTAVAAAASAEAARVAAQPLDPVTRAAEGFRIASGTPPPNAGVSERAVADAGANAKTAMTRTDLPPEIQTQVNTVLERLGNGVIDGKIDPHMNNEFRQQLYNLANASPTDPKSMGEFRDALAHTTRAAQIVDHLDLAKGTSLAFDNQAGKPTGATGLPVLDVPKLDADLYYQSRDGVLNVESSKYSAATLADTAKKQASGKVDQIARQGEWEAKGTAEAPRQAGFFVLDKNAGFGNLMNDTNLATLEKHVGNPDARSIIIGERAYSVNDLKTLDAAGKAHAESFVQGKREAHIAAGNTPESFKPGSAYGEFYKETLASPDAAMKAYGVEVGEASPQLKAGARPEIGNVRQGAVAGAAGAGIVSLIHLGTKGDVTFEDVKTAALDTGKGTVIGAASAKAEQYVIPAVERKIGTAVESRATQFAVSKLGQSAAVSAGSGVAAKTVVSRIVGSTAVGTAVTTAMSIYENREGVAKGDSKAIGNVTADTAVGVVAVGASSILGAAATGALAGSVAPGVGTVIGFGVGLAVGVGVAYGAQISGVRDSIADGAGKAVDWVKSWF